MKSILFTIALAAGCLFVSCDKSQDQVQKNGCQPCKDLTYLDASANLPDNVSKTIVEPLEKTTKGDYYQAGRINYHENGRLVAWVTYKKKKGTYIGTKHTSATSDNVAAHSGIAAGGCVQNVPTTSVVCCSFKQETVK